VGSTDRVACYMLRIDTPEMTGYMYSLRDSETTPR
jgi:hypothetical protein